MENANYSGLGRRIIWIQISEVWGCLLHRYAVHVLFGKDVIPTFLACFGWICVPCHFMILACFFYDQRRVQAAGIFQFIICDSAPQWKGGNCFDRLGHLSKAMQDWIEEGCWSSDMMPDDRTNSTRECCQLLPKDGATLQLYNRSSIQRP